MQGIFDLVLAREAEQARQGGQETPKPHHGQADIHIPQQRYHILQFSLGRAAPFRTG